jgi:hypothetical protein
MKKKVQKKFQSKLERGYENHEELQEEAHHLEDNSEREEIENEKTNTSGSFTIKE